MCGRFSNPYNKNLLAVVEEPDPVVFNRHSNSFKDTITNSVASFEIKGGKLNINIENKLRFIFISNSLGDLIQFIAKVLSFLFKQVFRYEKPNSISVLKMIKINFRVVQKVFNKDVIG